jgi:hypothetical protein
LCCPFSQEACDLSLTFQQLPGLLLQLLDLLVRQPSTYLARLMMQADGSAAMEFAQVRVCWVCRHMTAAQRKTQQLGWRQARACACLRAVVTDASTCLRSTRSSCCRSCRLQPAAQWSVTLCSPAHTSPLPHTLLLLLLLLLSPQTLGFKTMSLLELPRLEPAGSAVVRGYVTARHNSVLERCASAEAELAELKALVSCRL